MSTNTTNITNSAATIFADGWVDQPNGRGTIDILWSCIFTISVATFTVLHLNLPASTESHLRVLVRKTKWMTAAVVVPEVITASAFAQYVAARNSAAAMRALGAADWSMRHAFFLNMGGVWLRPRDSAAFPLNAAQLLYLAERGHVALPPLSASDIWDRSKADTFAKLFACLQIAWLVLQCVGRALQRLPITPLETATVGFAVPSLATFVLWINKPKDIAVPTFLDAPASTEELLVRITPPRSAWRQTPLDFVDTINSPSFTSEIILKYPHWPMRKAFLGPSTRIRNDVFALKYTVLDQLFVAVVWVAYAGVHLSAWSFDFPSRVEQLLWRTACLVMVGSMVIFFITSNRRFYQLVAIILPWKKKELDKVVSERQGVSTLQILLGMFTFFTYLSARLCLIVQVFLAMRKMPVGAFDTVNWTGFLPHV